MRGGGWEEEERDTGGCVYYEREAGKGNEEGMKSVKYRRIV